MKSINQIFKNNKSLMDEPEVRELIEYSQELEGQVMENKQSEKFSFEDKLTYLVREIHQSLRDLEKQEEEHERWGYDKPNYNESIKNLGKYIRKFSIDNRFRL